MPKKPETKPFHVLVTCSPQISDSHCGPAVVQMLLANVGVAVTQEQIAEAGGATRSIEEHGMRVDQLAAAVHALAPEAQLWVKDHAKIADVERALNEYRYPVGVEWQGVFDGDEDEDDDDESDAGHYSIVSYVDPDTRQLIIVDPYRDYASQDRIFPVDFFVRRWWDFNEVADPETGKARYVEDRRLMFIVTPIAETFPAEVGMQRA